MSIAHPASTAGRWILVCAVWFMVRPTMAAEVAIPGTSVSLDAPDGYVLSSTFSGLEDASSGSSITITELPAESYDEVATMFSDLRNAAEGFATRGVVVERAERFALDDQTVPVLVGYQETSVGRVEKYMALLRGEVMVLVAFNDRTKELTDSAVKQILASVRLGSAATLAQQLDELSFTFQAVDPFHTSRTLGGSAALLQTFEDIDPTGLKPAVVIGGSLRPMPPTLSPQSVARAVVLSTHGFEESEITVEERRSFAGTAGRYLEAVADNRKIVQFVSLAPDRTYIRLVAFGETSALDAVLPEVEKIAASVSRR